MSFHVAVIPDGNRRWARARGLSPFAGHAAGGEALAGLVDTAVELGIDWFTFWGASIENLTKRSPEEVRYLNSLFAERLQRLAESSVMHSYRIRVLVLGAWEKYLSPQAQAGARAVMAATDHYKGRTLTLLIAYDGVSEMVAAIQRLTIAGRNDPALAVTPEAVKASLITSELPPVDLVIRTGGEPHWSAGFLMWEAANAQLIFIGRLWPDFTPEDLAAAIAEYRSRQRRFGA